MELDVPPDNNTTTLLSLPEELISAILALLPGPQHVCSSRLVCTKLAEAGYHRLRSLGLTLPASECIPTGGFAYTEKLVLSFKAAEDEAVTEGECDSAKDAQGLSGSPGLENQAVQNYTVQSIDGSPTQGGMLATNCVDQIMAVATVGLDAALAESVPQPHAGQATGTSLTFNVRQVEEGRPMPGQVNNKVSLSDAGSVNASSAPGSSRSEPGPGGSSMDCNFTVNAGSLSSACLPAGSAPDGNGLAQAPASCSSKAGILSGQDTAVTRTMHFPQGALRSADQLQVIARCLLPRMSLLRSVSLHKLPEDCMDAAARALQALQGSLARLCISRGMHSPARETEDALWSAMASLPRLRSLTLSGGTLSDCDARGMVQLTQLRKLRVQGTVNIAPGMCFLSSLTGLTKLVIEDLQYDHGPIYDEFVGLSQLASECEAVRHVAVPYMQYCTIQKFSGCRTCTRTCMLALLCLCQYRPHAKVHRWDANIRSTQCFIILHALAHSAPLWVSDTFLCACVYHPGLQSLSFLVVGPLPGEVLAWAHLSKLTCLEVTNHYDEALLPCLTVVLANLTALKSLHLTNFE